MNGVVALLVVTPPLPGVEPTVVPEHHAPLRPSPLTVAYTQCCFITHSPAGCSRSYCPMVRGSSTDAAAPAGAAVVVVVEAVVCLGEGEGPCPGGRASSPSMTYRR